MAWACEDCGSAELGWAMGPPNYNVPVFVSTLGRSAVVLCSKCAQEAWLLERLDRLVNGDA